MKPSNLSNLHVDRPHALAHSDAASPSSNRRPSDVCDELWSEQRVAAYLGIAAKTLRSWRCTSGHLPFVRISARIIRYRRADVEAFVRSRVRTSTSDPGDLA